MSSSNQGFGDGGDDHVARSALDISSPTETAEDSTEMGKRAAAKQLIERYYYQLKDGCGRPDCTNEFCASSKQFCYGTITANQAAVTAVELLQRKAELCDFLPNKMAKGSSSECQQGTQCGTKSSSPPSPVPVNDTLVMTCDIGDSKPSTSNQLLTAKSSSKQISPSSSPQLGTRVKFLTVETLNEIIETCRLQDNWSHLIRTIGYVYNNAESLLLSFRKSPSKESIRAMETDSEKDTDEQEESCRIDSPEPSPGHSASELPSQQNQAADEVTLDLTALQDAYSQLFAIPNHPFQPALINALTYLSRNLEMDLRYHRAYDRDPNYLNTFIMIMEIPTLHSPEFIETATPAFCKALSQLPIHAQAKLARVWAKYPREKLKGYVDCLQQLITVKVITTQWTRSHIVNDDEGITGAARVMKIIYYACLLGGTMYSAEILEQERLLNVSTGDGLSELLAGAVGREQKEKAVPKEDPLQVELKVNPLDCREPVLPPEDFVNEPLCEQVEMDRDFAYYKADGEPKFSFMTHAFLLTTSVKNMGMYYDNRIRMLNERRVSLFQSIVHGAPTMPYLRLHIRRDHIIDDALVALEMAAMDNPGDLKKQLYIEFEGEQGIDEGGVSKEFFQLVVEEIFNPDIGMFTYHEETRCFWFNSTSFENVRQFTLIGIVLGLAIYNNVILSVQFPMVVYRKLMGKQGTFLDLKHSHPTLARGLQELLDYTGDDVEDVFMQNFCISYTDVFGNVLKHNLVENGDTVPVTNMNKQEFVELYADFLLNKCIDKQFRAFHGGFHMVTDESPIKMLFRPEEIELLVCGNKEFDFDALEQATEYDGGFTGESATILNFWQVVHEMTDDQKRQLLQFTTGSDRVPVGGLAKLKMIIAKNGPDSDRLPTAHTCFNVLLLPDYASKEKLKERLMIAITHAKGFGML